MGDHDMDSPTQKSRIPSPRHDKVTFSELEVSSNQKSSSLPGVAPTSFTLDQLNDGPSKQMSAHRKSRKEDLKRFQTRLKLILSDEQYAEIQDDQLFRAETWDEEGLQSPSHKSELQKQTRTMTMWGARHSMWSVADQNIEELPQYGSEDAWIHVRMRHDILAGIAPKHHQTVNWVNLYFDLIYVAAIIKFSDAMASDYENTYQYLLSFVLFLTIWEETVLVENRFEFKGWWLKFIMKFSFVIHGGMVLGIGINTVGMTKADHFKAMFVFYAIAWAQTSFLFYCMFRLIPKAEKHSSFFGLAHMALSILALLTAFLNPLPIIPTLLIFIFLVWGIHMATYYYESLQLSINVHHYIERHGLLIIILLGEGIISLVSADTAVDLDQYVLVFGSYFTISLLYFLYFEFLPKSIARKHGLRSNRRALIWQAGHQILHPAILTMCIGCKLLLKYQVYYYNQENSYRRLLGSESSSDSYSSYPKYTEYADLKHVQLVCWGLFTSFASTGLQWFSHHFDLKASTNSSLYIVISVVLHCLAMLVPLLKDDMFKRRDLCIYEMFISFSCLVSCTLFEAKEKISAGGNTPNHKQKSSNFSYHSDFLEKPNKGKKGGNDPSYSPGSAGGIELPHKEEDEDKQPDFEIQTKKAALSEFGKKRSPESRSKIKTGTERQPTA